MMVAQIVLALQLLLSASLSEAAMLDAKPGLWESTTTTQVEGGVMPQIPDVSKLTPEQRARVEKSVGMRAGGRPSVSTVRQCVTAQMLEKWDTFAKSERGDECQRSVLDQSSRHVKMSLSCGNGKSTGDMELTLSGSDRVSGKMAMVMRTDSGNRKINASFDSRWLGADCGNLKPGERRAVSGG
jgi:hypothetical protein